MAKGRKVVERERARQRQILLGAAMGAILLAGIGVAYVVLAPGDAAPALEAEWPNPGPPNPMKGGLLVVAHRGTLQGLPENSIEGLHAAFRAPDVDVVEADVQMDDEGRLRLSHDLPVDPGAPHLSDAWPILERAHSRLGKSIVLDVKGDAVLASRIYNETPGHLRDATVYLIKTKVEALRFREMHADARIWVSPLNERQGEEVAPEIRAEAVVINAGYASLEDVAVHQEAGTPVVMFAINSLSRARELGLHGVLVKVAATGQVEDVLG